MQLLLFVYNRAENSYDNHSGSTFIAMPSTSAARPRLPVGSDTSRFIALVRRRCIPGRLTRVSNSTYRAWKLSGASIPYVLSSATQALCPVDSKCFADQRSWRWYSPRLPRMPPEHLRLGHHISNNELPTGFLTTTLWRVGVYLLHVARPVASSLVRSYAFCSRGVCLTKQHGLLVLANFGALLLQRVRQQSPFRARSLCNTSVLLCFLLLGIGRVSRYALEIPAERSSCWSATNVFPHRPSAARQHPACSTRSLFGSRRCYGTRRSAMPRVHRIGQLLFANTRWFDYDLLFVKPRFHSDFASQIMPVAWACSCFPAGACTPSPRLSFGPCTGRRFPQAPQPGCFFLVPLLQTLQFPYFSSMKSQFILPRVIGVAACLGYAARNQALLVPMTLIAYRFNGQHWYGVMWSTLVTHLRSSL
jgi:hypothetical protein